MNRFIAFTTPHGRLDGLLTLPAKPRGMVIIATLHPGSHSLQVNSTLVEHGFATLALELLTEQELHFPDSAHNVPLLTSRLLQTLEVIGRDADTLGLPVAILAAAPVTPAAIRAAVQRDQLVKALVCHGGIIDLAGKQYLELLAAPLLMLADEDDHATEGAFRRGAGYLAGPAEFAWLPPGANPAAAAWTWLDTHLAA